jgi:hypothetical protein
VVLLTRGAESLLQADALVTTRAKWGLVLAYALALFALGGVAPRIADAAPVPTWTSPCSADLDPGVCERATYIASEVSTIDAESSDTRTLVGWGIGVLLVLVVTPFVVRLFPSA